MKFKGVIEDVTALRSFLYIGIGITKLSKTCIIRITDESVSFVAIEHASGHPFIWCELHRTTYFREYIFTGASDEQNEIYLDFHCEHMAKALVTLKENSKALKMKLTCQENPCLSFVIEQGSTETVFSREYVYDVPVSVVSRSHWDDYKPPEFVDFHVTIHLPCLKPIKKMIERMNNVSHQLKIQATRSGRLSLNIRTNFISLTSNFCDLGIQSFDVGSINTQLSATQESVVSATIDGRKFLNFLNGMHITNYRATCSIVDAQLVKIHMENPGAMSLQCFFLQQHDA